MKHTADAHRTLPAIRSATAFRLNRLRQGQLDGRQDQVAHHYGHDGIIKLEVDALLGPFEGEHHHLVPQRPSSPYEVS